MDQTPTAPDLRAWLVERVAEYANVPAERVSTDVDLTEYGLDSISALTMCTDIEDAFGVSVEPTALWDHTTIDAFGAFVLDRISTAA
ncbi:acyl carrier protein [Saccharothrix longispora]|uniref:acyl carrier protein n=1 Tax=Saccharothrix longispora TaxID=33920 RepID=UPI0028FDB2E2|nr:acyl carrier protein [Saccharothrix longispora]MDU0293219.1 acyl carrier protein [Saccharothrix longispora]